MRCRSLLATVVVLLLSLAGLPFASAGDPSPPVALGKIQPPGGVPLFAGRPGMKIPVEGLNQARLRLESAPEAELTKWVGELERIAGQKVENELEEAGCRTYFVIRMSVAFDGLQWNARKAESLFQRARTMPPAEARLWQEAFQAVLKREISRAYMVPLVLLPVEALHVGPRFNTERSHRYLARLKQLTAEDLALWQSRVDRFGGTDLDAAVNIVLLEEFFTQEKFQRDRFRAAVKAGDREIRGSGS